MKSIFLSGTKIKKGGNIMDRNQDLKNLIRASNIRNWQIAEELGISENTFYRMLRKELSNSDKEQILKAIETVKMNNFIVLKEQAGII
jgi:transposase-like protein